MGEEDPRKYVQIAVALRAAIAEGELTAGDRVSITSLVAEHRVARQTAAKALSVLTGEGVLRRYPGLGYIVLPDRG